MRTLYRIFFCIISGKLYKLTIDCCIKKEQNASSVHLDIGVVTFVFVELVLFLYCKLLCIKAFAGCISSQFIP